MQGLQGTGGGANGGGGNGSAFSQCVAAIPLLLSSHYGHASCLNSLNSKLRRSRGPDWGT